MIINTIENNLPYTNLKFDNGSFLILPDVVGIRRSFVDHAVSVGLALRPDSLRLVLIELLCGWRNQAPNNFGYKQLLKHTLKMKCLQHSKQLGKGQYIGL